MKRLTIEIIDRYSGQGSPSTAASTPVSFTTLTAFDVPSLPEADWPLVPAVEHAVERAVLTALASGQSLCETVEVVSASLAAIGASLSHDDLLTRIAASGLQRS